jgi:hypothetical protein
MRTPRCRRVIWQACSPAHDRGKKSTTRPAQHSFQSRNDGSAASLPQWLPQLSLGTTPPTHTTSQMASYNQIDRHVEGQSLAGSGVVRRLNL